MSETKILWVSRNDMRAPEFRCIVWAEEPTKTRDRVGDTIRYKGSWFGDANLSALKAILPKDCVPKPGECIKIAVITLPDGSVTIRKV